MNVRPVARHGGARGAPAGRPSGRHATVLLVPLLAGLAVGLPVRGDEEEPAAPTPDFAYYEARVAPLVARLCAECHADPRRSRGAHRLRPAPGRRVRERDHRRNYETILRLIEPGNPAASTWLLKALGPRQGGLEHEGGALVRIDSLEYGTMVDFIDGVRLEDRAAASPPAPAPPLVGKEGTRLAAADAHLVGDVRVEAPHEEEGADTQPSPDEGERVVAGAEGGAVEFVFRLPALRAWRVELNVLGRGEGLTVAADDGPAVALPAVAGGPGVVGPALLLDDATPFVQVEGDVHLEDEGLRVEGRPGRPASVVFACGRDHDRLEAEIALDAERDGGDDALLLFGVTPSGTAGIAGLVDGGRRVAIGRTEREGPSWLASEGLQPPGPEAPVRLTVRFEEAEVVVLVDGSRRVAATLEGPWGQGPVGLLAHGGVTLRALSAHAGYEVWRARPRVVPALVLGPGEHRLRVGLPASAPALEALFVAPLEPAPR